MITVTSGMLSMALLEIFKWIMSKLKKEPDFNLPPILFKIGIPVLNVLMPFLLVALGFPPDQTEVLTMTWLEVVRYVLRVLVASVITLFSYEQGLKPLKEYTARVKLEKAEAEASLNGREIHPSA
jgi:hypothetical protein